MVDMIDSQLNSGWIAKTNSVSNPTSLYKSGQGQVVFLKPEAQMTDVQRLQAPDIPQGMFQLEAEFEKDIMEIAGVNSELFGMADNDKIETAGVLSKMRQSAGLVNLQDLFDGLRESQKLLGQKVLQLIQNNYSAEKIKLITKRDPTPEFYSKAFSKYDIVVEEGIQTDTQRQSQFAQMAALRAMGVQFTDEEVVDASNLHDKKKYKERLATQQQAQQQMQEVQSKLAMESVQSKTESDKALAAERINKIQLDAALSAERISRAEQDKTASILDLIKAIKELQGIDLEHLGQKIEMIKALEAPIETNQKPKENSNG